MALPATDAFTGTNATALQTYSASWSSVTGAMEIQSNGAANVNSSEVKNCYRWNADTFANDQYAQGVITAAGSRLIGVAVRCSASVNSWYGYMGVGNYSNGSLVKWVSGTETVLGNTGNTWHNNDTIKLSVTGTTLNLLKNGAADTAIGDGSGNVTDASLSTGYAGLSGSGSSSFSILDSWEGGDVGGGGAAGQPTRRRFGGVPNMNFIETPGIKVW